MKNEEKFKTVEERQAALSKYCDTTDCHRCRYNKKGMDCTLIWLASEYKKPEPENDVPFMVVMDRSRDAIMICRKDTQFPIRIAVHEITSALIELYNGQCESLNAAALAWHERMCKKEKGEAK